MKHIVNGLKLIGSLILLAAILTIVAIIVVSVLVKFTYTYGTITRYQLTYRYGRLCVDCYRYTINTNNALLFR